MTTVKEHYDQHLGSIYTWMLGGMDAIIQRAREDLKEMEIGPCVGKVAIDLGAGCGAHAIALAELGYSTIAIDNCEGLLGECKPYSKDLPVKLVQADLTDFEKHCPSQADVIICLGDTLTHLPDLDTVKQFLKNASRLLAPDGRFCITFRDYDCETLEGDARFIPVRSDDTRILTCFLEYEEDYVLIHDLLHERVENEWKQSVSTYRKLRLDPMWVGDILAKQYLCVHFSQTSNGMMRLIAVADEDAAKPRITGPDGNRLKINAQELAFAFESNDME